MTWPSVRVVAAAFRGGPTEIIRTPVGPCGGVASSNPDVFLLVGPRTGGACARCGTFVVLPPVPTSRGLNGAGEPLFPPGTGAHATFVLTFAHRFGRTHDACSAREETS